MAVNLVVQGSSEFRMNQCKSSRLSLVLYDNVILYLHIQFEENLFPVNGTSYLHLVYKKPAAVLTKKLILNFIYTRKKTGCK